MKRRLYQLTIIVIGLFVIYGSSRNISELWQQKQRVWRMQQEVKDLETKEAELKKKLEYYQSGEYVEKMAREKLLLQKEGETIILLPQEQNQDQSFPQSRIPLRGTNIESQVERENKSAGLSIWRKWEKLFRFKF